MPFSPPAFRLLLVTDRKLSRRPLVDSIADALAAGPPGSSAVQLREKDLEARALFDLAKDLRLICRRHGAPLLVNDRIDMALALDLDGVHLPQASFGAAAARQLLGPSKLVGVSCHSPTEVAAAREAGANYATFGPVFDTPTKREFGPPVGLELFEKAASLGLPLLGLGGIGPGNAAEVLLRGGAGIAAIRTWLGEEPPGPAVARLLAQVTKGSR